MFSIFLTHHMTDRAKMPERAFNLKEIAFFRAGPDDHNQIEAPNKFAFMQPVRFADQAAEMMSFHTVSDLLADRDAQAVLLRRSLPDPVRDFQLIFFRNSGEKFVPPENIEDQKTVCAGLSVLIDKLEVLIFSYRILHTFSLIKRK